MKDLIARVESDESWRREAFPVVGQRVFMAHAAVTTVPKVAVDAMNRFNEASATGELDYTQVLVHEMDRVRASAARLIHCQPQDVALLGPTSLGLSLVAQGLAWKAGDEIIAYHDDYPANVYPWTHLERLGVRVVWLRPDEPGRITPELVREALTPKTKLVALASCHFLTGYRLDVAAISEILRQRGVLFCLDGIQTAGAFEVDVNLVDYFSADSHKWLLGPMTAGVFYVNPLHAEPLTPALVGAWNVKCPQFISQDQVEFESGGRRFEPGVLNAQGLYGMQASMDLLTGIGISQVSRRLLELKAAFVETLEGVGLTLIGPRSGDAASGITTVTHLTQPSQVAHLAEALQAGGVIISYRHDREGVPYLRFSPHFYNTYAEIEAVGCCLRKASA